MVVPATIITEILVGETITEHPGQRRQPLPQLFSTPMVNLSQQNLSFPITTVLPFTTICIARFHLSSPNAVLSPPFTPSSREYRFIFL